MSFQRAAILAALLTTGLAACGGPECENPSLTIHPDDDGDGYGRTDGAVLACSIKEGYSVRSGDCDDNSPELNPGVEEICDDIDNNCNNKVDEGLPDQNWYIDGDGDGRGAEGSSPLVTCLEPAGHSLYADDCDDTNPDNFPGNPEVCDGVDNNCDGRVDDLDPEVDPDGFLTFYLDNDGDGFGDPYKSTEACAAPKKFVDNFDDCDDANAAINPGADELCNEIDDNCDSLVDDDDPAILASELTTYYLDADLDGHGDATATIDACFPVDGASLLNDDCDDANGAVWQAEDWYVDADGDGAGTGTAVEVSTCYPVDTTLAPNDLDCDDNDPIRSPFELDICEDGIDQDCDGVDEPCQLPVSCKAYLDDDPTLPSGTYPIEPVLGTIFDVYCDMTTDGGGWTLVASSRNTFDDAAIGYHADIATITPSGSHNGVWGGLRNTLIMGNSDIRFACKLNAGGPNFAVDLSFYDNNWYRVITSGPTDADSCFAAGGLVGVAPARTNNLTGGTRALGDNWNSGNLWGEDSCGDTGDFTVDFDDRGMDSNQGDGTDWGEDDSTRKCTGSNLGDGFFIFVRELPAP